MIPRPFFRMKEICILSSQQQQPVVISFVCSSINRSCIQELHACSLIVSRQSEGHLPLPLIVLIPTILQSYKNLDGGLVCCKIQLTLHTIDLYSLLIHTKLFQELLFENEPHFLPTPIFWSSKYLLLHYRNFVEIDGFNVVED